MIIFSNLAFFKVTTENDLDEKDTEQDLKSIATGEWLQKKESVGNEIAGEMDYMF